MAMGRAKDGEVRVGLPITSDGQVERPKQRNMVVFSVGLYWLTSISLVLLNKVMFSSPEVGLKGAPIFLTWTQILVAVGCCLVVHAAKPSFHQLDFFPYFEYDFSIALKVAPLTAIFLGMIVFNNLCLKYVEVSFYQVARSLSIIFNIVFSFLLLGQKTTSKALGACAVIVAGYYLGVDGEVRFSRQGVIFGVISSVFVSLYSIFVKRVLKILHDNHWRLLIYNNMNATWMMPPLILFFGETESVIQSPNVWLGAFWGMILLVGMFGFMINIASFMQIKYTSPLSHNVSGTFKACVQTLLGLMIWKNPVSSTGLFGTFLSIFGCGLYGYVRYLEGKKKPEGPKYTRVSTSETEMDNMDRK